MKVGHIIDSGGLYGAEVMLITLAEEQVRLGLEPVIMSIGEKHIGEKDLEREAENKGLRVEKFRMRAGLSISGIRQILKHIKKNKYSIIHSHGYKPNIMLGFLPKFIRKVPMVSTLHGYTSRSTYSWLSLYESLDKMSLRRLDGVIAVSYKLMEQLKPQLPDKQKTWVVENGVKPLVEFSNKEGSPQEDGADVSQKNRIEKFCETGFIVGAIGRLSKEKNFGMLIDAVGMAQKRNADIKLVILGEGNERAKLEAKVKSREMESCVLMPGYTSNAARYFRLFDLFVISSFTEGLPMTLLEAMSCSVPVLSTSIGGVPVALEYGKAGELIESGDVEAMADRIANISMKYDEASAKAKIAKNIFLKKYSSEKMAGEYLEIYREVV